MSPWFVDRVVAGWAESARHWRPVVWSEDADCTSCWTWPFRAVLPEDIPNELVHELRNALDAGLADASRQHRRRLAEEFAVEDLEDLDDFPAARRRIDIADDDRFQTMLDDLVDRRPTFEHVVADYVRPQIDAWVSEASRHLLVEEDGSAR